VAIGTIHLAWLRRLAEQNCFSGLHTIIDLGPQDIQLGRSVLERAMRSVVPPKEMDGLIAQIYAGGKAAGRHAQAPFYSLFGLGPYASIDASDDRATYRLDLSNPIEALPEFDVVTNFGTTEHVFNIGEAFRSIHQLTKPGGVSLHCVPCFAFINHGFYNIHPNLFVEMARANDYSVVDVSYFDNAFVRNVRMGREGVDHFDPDSLPVKLADMENTQVFMTKVVDIFYQNLIAAETRETIAALDPTTRDLPKSTYPGRKHHICFVFDLIFFAMRRPMSRRPFVMPMQNTSGVRPLIASDRPVIPAKSLFARVLQALRDACSP
jgi:Methyltransferase domain